MRPLLPLELADLLGGHLFGSAPGSVTGWTFDSRKVNPGDVYIAIVGRKADGHDFAEAAFASGASLIIATKPVSVPHILVESIPQAFARLAAKLRDGFSGTVVGITGSAGKTTTKEMVALALGTAGSVLSTPGNWNTELTAPLVWSMLEPSHRFAVIEMAMRGKGQIADLARPARPQIVIVTNIGYSHIELLGSRQGIAEAKSELLQVLPKDGHGIVWAEDDFCDYLVSRSNAPVLKFGFSEEADCRIESYEPDGLAGSVASGICFGTQWTAKLNYPGRHLALNAAAAILAAHCCNIPVAQAAEALEGLKLPDLRMQTRDWHGATLLLDAYNASPASMKALLETAAAAEGFGKKVAVVGEMRELGEFEEGCHRELAADLVNAKVDAVVAVGRWSDVVAGELERLGFKGPVEKAATGMDAKPMIEALVKPGDLVFAKASRGMRFEEIFA